MFEMLSSIPDLDAPENVSRLWSWVVHCAHPIKDKRQLSTHAHNEHTHSHAHAHTHTHIHTYTHTLEHSGLIASASGDDTIRIFQEVFMVTCVLIMCTGTSFPPVDWGVVSLYQCHV